MGIVAKKYYMRTQIFGLESIFQLSNKQLEKSASLLLHGGETRNMKPNTFSKHNLFCLHA